MSTREVGPQDAAAKAIEAQALGEQQPAAQEGTSKAGKLQTGDASHTIIPDVQTPTTDKAEKTASAQLDPHNGALSKDLNQLAKSAADSSHEVAQIGNDMAGGASNVVATAMQESGKALSTASPPATATPSKATGDTVPTAAKSEKQVIAGNANTFIQNMMSTRISDTSFKDNNPGFFKDPFAGENIDTTKEIIKKLVTQVMIDTRGSSSGGAVRQTHIYDFCSDWIKNLSPESQAYLKDSDMGKSLLMVTRFSDAHTTRLYEKAVDTTGKPDPAGIRLQDSYEELQKLFKR